MMVSLKTSLLDLWSLQAQNILKYLAKYFFLLLSIDVRLLNSIVMPRNLIPRVLRRTDNRTDSATVTSKTDENLA